jgi:hypothetical protein
LNQELNVEVCDATTVNRDWKLVTQSRTFEFKECKINKRVLLKLPFTGWGQEL